MNQDSIEIINTIHKYLIGGSIFFAFFHFIILFAKAYKKYAIAEDFTAKELERVKKEYAKNSKFYLKTMWHPFKVFLIYTLCISTYTVLVIELGLIW